MNKAITAPKPFTRDIWCNRITLGRYNATEASYTLTEHQLDCWESKLTLGPFRRAVRSIAKERAAAAGVQVMVLAPGGMILYTTPKPKG